MAGSVNDPRALRLTRKDIAHIAGETNALAPARRTLALERLQQQAMVDNPDDIAAVKVIAEAALTEANAAAGAAAHALTVANTAEADAQAAQATADNKSPQIQVFDEGVTLTTEAFSFDFQGAGVTATESSGAVTVTVPGGSGGTVTSVSSANGDLTVATGTTTPVLTVVSAPKWSTARTLSFTGNVTGTGSVDGSASVATALTIGAGQVTEAMQVLANNTTNDVTTARHGYAPILPNDATKYLDGTGAYSVPPGTGSGTVTHTGTLTANRLIIGNGTADITVLGSLGTTTTVLHGNAGGAPTFAAVSLTADVSGILPAANGGTGAGSFTAAAWNLISEVVTSGSQTSVTFSSIPTTWRDLVLKVTGRGGATANTVQIQLQFNSDATANYDWQYLDGNASTPSSGVFFAQSSIAIGDLPAANATASVASACETTIQNYKGTTFQKTTLGTSQAKWGTTSGTTEIIPIAGWWRSTAAINAVKVLLSSGGFVDDSIVSLYGRF